MRVARVLFDYRMVWFSEVDLRVAAGAKSFERGRELISAVSGLRTTAEGVRAAVHGSAVYDVFLGPASPGLVGECSCPFGSAGNFCKHCVAVGLVVLAREQAAGVDLRPYLGSLPADELAELVNELASADPTIHRVLATRAAQAQNTPQVAVLQRQLDDALRVRGAVDGAGAEEYAKVAGELLDTVAKLVGSGHAAEARPLARNAVERITESLMLIEDTAGAVGELCQRAVALYARACVLARPNGTKLAAWLFRMQYDSQGWPAIELADFAEALGDTGLAAYRDMVEGALDTRIDGTDAGDIGRALTVLLMKERLAKFEGAPDTVVDLLPDPAMFLGVTTGEQTQWLVDFLVSAYLNLGRGKEALELRRAQLASTPNREQFAELRQTAQALEEWSGVRSWAVEVLRAHAEEDGDGEELVAALLDDEADDEAWEAAARYGCGQRMWLRAARIRAAEHPEDVLAGYRAWVHEAIGRGSRPGYREAVGLLEELRGVAEKCERAGEFEAFLDGLRAGNRRRSALLDELDKAGLG
jgi:uncharacterized Zn finger protein